MKTEYGKQISKLNAELESYRHRLKWAEQERKKAELTTSKEMFWHLMAIGFEEWEASLHGDEILMSDRKDAKEEVKQLSQKLHDIKKSIRELQKLNTPSLKK